MAKPVHPPSKIKRLAVARFWYEGNAFTPIPCTLEDFKRHGWGEGASFLEAARGTASELGAVEYFSRTHSDWDVVVLRCAAAQPGGPIQERAYQTIKSDILLALEHGSRLSPWDAVYLSLHGAAITDTSQSPDLDLVRAVRELLPDTPIGASFDLHGNLSSTLGDLLDVVTAYKTYPHVDQYETAARVLSTLDACVTRGIRTRVTVHKPDLLLSSFNMRTKSGPMCDLQKLASEASQKPIIDISIFGGFPYSDTEDTGASIVVTSQDSLDATERVEEAIVTLSKAMRQRAGEFSVKLPTAKHGIEQALASLRKAGGTVAITDPGDNPASGGSGDTTELFKALVETPFHQQCVFASFADPKAVEAAAVAGIGNNVLLSLGGRFNPAFGNPVQVYVQVQCLTDGEFTNVGPKESGVHMHFGQTALVSMIDRPNIKIILTSFVVPANDPGFFELHGIELDKVQLLCVKAKNHFRAAFASRCQDIIDIDAPGPAALDLSLLPFRRIRHSLLTD